MSQILNDILYIFDGDWHGYVIVALLTMIIMLLLVKLIPVKDDDGAEDEQ